MDLYHYYSVVLVIKISLNRLCLSIRVFITTLTVTKTACLGYVTLAIPSSKNSANEFNIKSILYSAPSLIKKNQLLFLSCVCFLLSVGMSLLVTCFHRSHLYLDSLFKQRVIALVVLTLRDSIILNICGPHIRSRRNLRYYPRSIGSTSQTLEV